MRSNKSTARRVRRVIAPQRRHGKARVEAVLEAAAALFAEKGYEAATMAEIAARSGSPIGSLYRFFPNKELLASALIGRYQTRVEDEFRKIAARAARAPVHGTADAIIDFMMDHRRERDAMLALIEARSEWSVRREAFRAAALKHIARIVRVLAPKLPSSAIRDIAVILLHNMKAMTALRYRKNVPNSPGAMNELRHMNRLYLAGRVRG